MSAPMSPAAFRAAVESAARDAVRRYLEENPPGAPAPPAAPSPADPVHPDVGVFFRDFFSPRFARDPDAQAFNWCADPFEHIEFTEVMTVLWHSWEFLTQQDPAMGEPVWYRDWAYPLLDRLSNPEGTFSNCSRKEGGHDAHVRIRPLAQAKPR